MSYFQKTVGYFQGWRKYPGLVTFPHFLCHLPISPLDTLEDSAFSIDARGPKYPPKRFYILNCVTLKSFP